MEFGHHVLHVVENALLLRLVFHLHRIDHLRKASIPIPVSIPVPISVAIAVSIAVFFFAGTQHGLLSYSCC